MYRRPPSFSRPYTPFPYATLLRDMSSRPNLSSVETTDERTYRLLNEEIAGLHGEAGEASAREVGLAASLLSAEARLRNSGDMLHEVNHRAKNSIQKIGRAPV